MSGRPLFGTVVAIVLAAAAILAAPVFASPSGRVNGFPHPGAWAKSLDRDRDGLSNKAERRAGTNPRKADTDNEGLTDLVELRRTKTNPRLADTDGDGLTDWTEVNRSKTNPKNPDSDGDGVSDGVEVSRGTDPRSAPTPSRAPVPAPPAGPSGPVPPGTPEGPAPSIAAIWSPPADAEVGKEVILDGSASTGGPTISCTWAFENESGSAVFEQRTGCKVGFTFEAVGMKYVRLVVSDAGGDSASNKQAFAVMAGPVTTPPDTSISSGPSGTTTSTSASFAFTSTESGSSFECKLDSGAFAACASPKAYSGLADGTHTFSVQAKDASGNVDPSPATRSWTVDTSAPPDTTPPNTTISSTPASTTTSTSASFSFTSSEASSTFACSIDGGSYSSCTSPKAYSGLAVAGHSFAVRATDGAGNTDLSPATYSWTVESTPPPPDTTPPNTTISSTPASTTTSTSASFSFTSSESGSTFACSIDGGSYSSCTSPKAYSGLAVAGHSFAVRATDGAGNTDQSPATWSWTVQQQQEPPPSSNSCAAGAVTVTTASGVTSNVSSGKSVCVTAAIGDVSFGSGNRTGVIVSTEGSGSMGHLEISGTTGLTVDSARFRSVTIRGGDRTVIENSTIGGTPTNRVSDQLIFMPDTSNDVVIRNNDIGWTVADNSGNTGYGCRCYGTLNNLQFVGNKLHDLAADGFQGVGGDNVLIDRNEIGPVGANPSSSEHTDSIQITFNEDNLRITNNWIHNQGYYEGQAVANAGSTYIHGGSDGALTYENNLVQSNRGRTEICGLGTGGTSRSNITIRRNTWVDGGQAFNSFPGFEWDCDSGSNDTITRNIAVDPDGGLAQDGFASAIVAPNLWGNESLVTLDAQGNCTSSNCNPAGQEPIGYRKPTGVAW